MNSDPPFRQLLVTVGMGHHIPGKSTAYPIEEIVNTQYP